MKINALDEFLDINFTGYSQSQQIEKTYNLKVFGSKITKGPKQDRQKSATITSGGGKWILVLVNIYIIY